MSRALFVTGTGTDVGKTYIAALLVKKLAASGRNAGYFKAAMSGNVRRADGSLIPGDAQFVRQISGIAQPLEEICPYVYERACSPHLAARIEGHPVEPEVVKQRYAAVCCRYDFVTVEGSGGILCPLRFDEKIRFGLDELVRELGLASVIVADAGLGTINSVVLTAEAMQARGLPVRGVIFNRYHPADAMEEDNIRMCELLTGLPTLARVQPGDADIRLDAPEALYEEVRNP